MYALIFQRLMVEALFDVFYFPMWWYSAGAIRAAKFSVQIFQDGNAQLAPGLWLSNIFVPMFGQTDWQGRMISFFMRLVQVFIRGAALVVWLLFCVLIFCAWLSIPAVITYGIFKSIF